MDGATPKASWTFLTNHARVLIMIARDPVIRVRDLAQACEITERTVQAILTDLEADGYLTHVREGRRNRYLLTPGTQFRHRAEAEHKIAGLLELIINPDHSEPDSDPDQQPHARPHNDTTRTASTR